MLLIATFGFNSNIWAEGNNPTNTTIDTHTAAHHAHAYRAPNEAPTLITDVLPGDPEAKPVINKKTTIKKETLSKTEVFQEQPANQSAIGARGENKDQLQTEATAAIQNKELKIVKEQEQGVEKTSIVVDVEKVSVTPQASADLQVLEFVLTHQVVNLEPQEVVETFTEGKGRGFVFAKIAAKNPEALSFVWSRNNREYSRTKINVKSAKKWRGFSSITLRPGEWKVQLVGKNNAILAEKAFIIK